jgi:hypothetical protein
LWFFWRQTIDCEEEVSFIPKRRRDAAFQDLAGFGCFFSAKSKGQNPNDKSIKVTGLSSTKPPNRARFD